MTYNVFGEMLNFSQLQIQLHQYTMVHIKDIVVCVVLEHVAH